MFTIRHLTKLNIKSKFKYFLSKSSVCKDIAQSATVFLNDKTFSVLQQENKH